MRLTTRLLGMGDGKCVSDLSRTSSCAALPRLVSSDEDPGGGGTDAGEGRPAGEEGGGPDPTPVEVAGEAAARGGPVGPGGRPADGPAYRVAFAPAPDEGWALPRGQVEGGRPSLPVLPSSFAVGRKGGAADTPVRLSERSPVDPGVAGERRRAFA